VGGGGGVVSEFAAWLSDPCPDDYIKGLESNGETAWVNVGTTLLNLGGIQY